MPDVTYKKAKAKLKEKADKKEKRSKKEKVQKIKTKGRMK